MPVTAHPILVTPDVDRLRSFYGPLLGAEVVERVPEEGEVFYLGLRAGDAVLGLVLNVSVPVGDPGRVLVSFGVDDVDVLLPRVIALGGAVAGGPTDMPWGQRVLHVRDPDGNAVNLTAALGVSGPSSPPAAPGPPAPCR